MPGRKLARARSSRTLQVQKTNELRRGVGPAAERFSDSALWRIISLADGDMDLAQTALCQIPQPGWVKALAR